MVSEMKVMRKLYEVLVRDLNSNIDGNVEQLGVKNIFIDFPTVDNAPSPTTIWLQSNYSDYESLTVSSDNASSHISVFIIAKRAEGLVLQDKVFAVYDGLYKLLKNNPTLDGTITYCSIESFDYYPALEANPNVKGAEVSVNLLFEKEW